MRHEERRGLLPYLVRGVLISGAVDMFSAPSIPQLTSVTFRGFPAYA